jgi:glutamate N-acetyltransferase/amino-acid N-acetyltransferase
VSERFEIVSIARVRFKPSVQSKFKLIDGAVVAPQGFLAGGVFCDIKRLGTGKGSDKGRKRDLCLLVSETPAAVAGLFTTNQICAAPVKVCVSRVAKGVAQAVVVNSGNANACTGRQGMKDALAMTGLAERVLGLSTGRVLVGSTGRIGVQMPMEQVASGIVAAAEVLGSTTEHAAHAAEAIMTSDSRPKTIAIELKIGGRIVRIGGMCKGAGMIQPGMSPTGARPATAPSGVPAGLHATMLCFITTDADIAAKPLQSALNEAVASSFNRITVDGDMSTNDTVLALANGLAGNAAIRKASGKDFEAFQAALSHVCLSLAKMIVCDGEGVHRVVTVRVEGARSFADADAAARAVANSALVKTSWHGGDPNWGRIIDALGYSSAKIVEDKVDIGYAASGTRKILWSLRRGQPTKTAFADLWKAVQADTFELHIRLNVGKASAVMYAADLTEEYVDFNKGAIADPSQAGALGG